MAHVGSASTEKAIQFGAHRGLTGILSMPVLRTPSAPHVLILNSGILHRVGSGRVYVHVARALARAGVPSLRFDLSGIGDSERRRDVVSLRESVERDIAEAMEHLARHHGANEFVLMGLCSGAFDALHGAAGDERVRGAIMVDLTGPFQGWHHTMHRVRSRLLRPASWRRPIAKLAHVWGMLRKKRTPARPDAHVYLEGARSTPNRLWMEQQLDSLIRRGVRLCFVFTAGFELNYNHPSQFRATFPRQARSPLVETSYFAEADHAFSRRSDRDRLADLVAGWVSRGWESRGAA